ncbi:MAG: DUF3261 domain-containing protein [Deltaproteobacteria bacterium]|jgi:hypothetical protein|nr:DUF3261 domain-containing protein [Deltaproteobacteria bacterium]
MNKRLRQRLKIICLVLPLALLCGCAARPVDALPPARELFSPEAWQTDGIWLLRHKVRLEAPRLGFSRSFDGLMRLDADQGKLRVTALDGLGLRLFDLEIGPDWMRAIYLHPALKKIPSLTEHIVLCVRRIWFDCFAIMPQNIDVAGDGWDVSFSGKERGEPWASSIRFNDSRAGYTLTVRLLQAQREDRP